jgi:pimeloyl-ACP methyl ester carboxylesterase
MNAPFQTKSGFAKSNGIELCYEVFGKPDAPPLVLIMGLGAQMILWDDAFCQEIADRGFRVIRFDNRDAGKSSTIPIAVKVDLVQLIEKQIKGEPIDSPYTLNTMADDTAGLLDALGIEKAHLVGASMGGMIAQQTAVRYPDRVRSLVSIMSSTGNPELPGPTPDATIVLMTPPPATRDEYIKSFTKTWTVFRAGDFPEEEVRDAERAARNWDRGLNPFGTARQLLAIFASGNRKAGLAAIKAPTLVIHGDVDPLVRPEAGLDTADAIPGATMLMVTKMGHALPKFVWPEVIDAIAAHAKAADG